MTIGAAVLVLLVAPAGGRSQVVAAPPGVHPTCGFLPGFTGKVRLHLEKVAAQSGVEWQHARVGPVQLESARRILAASSEDRTPCSASIIVWARSTRQYSR